MEPKLIAAIIASRDAFNLCELAKIKKELSDKGEILYEEVAEYYNIDPEAKACDIEILCGRATAKYPKHEKVLAAVLHSLPEVSVENMKDYIVGLRRKKIKDKLATMFSVEGNDDEITSLLEEYYETVDDIEDKAGEPVRVFHNVELDELLAKVDHNSKIKLSPEPLNEATQGGVLRKHHILMFGRPDIGKSTHAIELCYGFLRQDLKVLYVSNEDPPEELIVRMLSRLCSMTRLQIHQDPNRARTLRDQRNFDKFIFAELTPGTPREIEALVREYEPDVLIVDQARNIEMGESSGVVQLEKVERFIRNIGKRHNMLTISFTQAGDSAHNKLVLEMNDVDGSKTGMQASADLMIGIGANEDYLLSNQRMLSFPKNKITGDKAPRRVSLDFSIYKVF